MYDCNSDYEEMIMPDEGDLHSATWMAYGATVDVWGTTSSCSANRIIARKDILRIAANISRFEKVKIIINEEDLDEASEFLSEICDEKTSSTKGHNLRDIEAGGKIEFLTFPVNDLWVRDTGPIFVYDTNKMVCGINFNFNGWGQCDTDSAGWKKCLIKTANGIIDQRIKEDKKIADFIIEHTGVKKINTWLVMEGGGVEVNGKGTAICTESCILNENRNPGKSKKDNEKELLRLLGIEKIIWLPGMKGKDITDGHVDFYARFVDDFKVVFLLDNDQNSPDYLVTHQNQQILSNATDAYGNKIIAIPLVSPDYKKVKVAFDSRNGLNKNKSYFNKDSFAAGYVGFYLANNCVLMAKFGDEEADERAFDIISDIFPDRTIMQITTYGLANGGGTIHCATQQQIQF